ncbi:glycosyltransferase family 2 protein [Defluviitalea phaphyphila]|uniref:glycosyltransferase family 2 protein n=1 Tax=Defluviitalea phaphyphila TaxID=1473580 RepID=UPI00073191E6|nr:glycosyltransferase family 2 protein [Defluviitalea phaphyphila]
MDTTVYSLVVPLYNEELVITECYKRLKQIMDTLNESYEIIFVNDGSKDNSDKIIEEICNKDSNVRLINFSRNFGHQSAITAGMQFSEGSAIIIIDADLQDPPEVIYRMIEKWKEGYDVVYGKRIKRKGETFFKKFTAKIFYKILDKLTDVNIPRDTGDFRLIDRKVCDVLNALPEKNRYVRGLVSWIGFKQTEVEFIREERFAGETKYSLKKMLKLAFDGITSFSYKPLKFASIIGIMMSIIGFIYLLVVLFKKFFTDKNIQGWTSLIGVNIMFSGIILLALGIMGEYIGRIYEEVKNRPIYIVKDTKGFGKKYEKNNTTYIKKI